MLARVHSGTQWRGQQDGTRWRLSWLLFASALMHIPLSPLGALLGLVDLLGGAGVTPGVVDLNRITAIPVQLEGEEGAGEVVEPQSAESPPRAIQEEDPVPEDPSTPAITAVAEPDPPDAGSEQVDADIADAADAAADAGVDGDATEASDAASDAGPRGILDPVALSGSAARVVNANANVRLLVHMDRIRAHPLGSQVGELLRNTYQWQDFFGPGGVDPMHDLDRILIAGPQLRDSSSVVAVLRYNVAQDRVRDAVDRLVRRDSAGGWLDAGAPAATARADGADRVFVLPAPHIAVVAPPSARDHALSLGRDTEFPPPQGSEAVNVYLVTPWRALIGMRFSIPKSVKEARISIEPTLNGGARGRVVGVDESADAAERNARSLERSLARFAFLGFIQRARFRAEGVKIHGEITATRHQLAFLLELALQQQKEFTARIEARRAAGARAAPDPSARGAPSKPVASAALSAQGDAAKSGTAHPGSSNSAQSKGTGEGRPATRQQAAAPAASSSAR